MQTELSFSLIFNQTLNFAKNRFLQILIVSVVLGILNILLTNLLVDKDAINQIPSYADPMTILSSMSQLLFVTIVVSLFIVSFCIATVYNLSTSNQFNIALLVSRTLSTIVKILGFNLLYFVVLFFAGIIFSLVLVVIQLLLPSLGEKLLIVGMLFLILFMMTIYNFFVGTIVAPSEKGFFQLFIESHQLAKRYWKFGFLMVVLNVLCVGIIAAFAMMTEEENMVVEMVLSSISNFVDIFVTCFFYRLCVLVTDKKEENNQDQQNNVVI